MDALTPTSTASFLQRFERLDGAVVEALTLETDASAATLRFRAYDTTIGTWCTLVCELRGELEYRWHQPPHGSRALLDDQLVIVWIEGRVYFVLDPLQLGAAPLSGAWPLETVRRSACYLGATAATWGCSASDAP
jgi:hypothetical protein